MPKTKVVLVIDDDPEFRGAVCDFLQEHNWTVLSATEGEEGIRMARAHHPPVLLCDLLMPRCNGFQVCSTIKRDPQLHDIRVIISSGRTFASDRQAAAAAGADEFLVKPLDPSKLLSILEHQLIAASRPAKPFSEQPDPAAAYLKFWGVRGSVPTPGPGTIKYGGNTSCVEVRVGDELIILDAGTGLRPLGRELTSRNSASSLNLTLLITHTHWDHIQGIPFFAPLFRAKNRVRILGYEGARQGFEGVLTSQMETTFFPIGLREVPANVDIIELKDMQFEVGGLQVRACFANHPGICMGYRIHTPQGSVAFFPDNEPRVSPRLDQANKHLGGSTSVLQRIEEFIRDSDVLIMDCQYDCEEYKTRVGWGHGCVDDVVKLAAETGVKHLFMFHHDPDHDDEKIDQMLEHARQLAKDRQWKLTIDAAREGDVFDLASRTLK